ncbi:cytochrome b/b6 domain-containing protein [Neoehrlichia mikurensis]|uniref:Cytochrome b/b6 domain-containing protein n=2 Tax=Neoehrlichia mikurensis TaxID=89586 RepID=A0A9Q9F339_9RICK|nr:cytochrome b/b6 domain-containing protein [Neoehrlichia mikurensis]UTO55129.1 cytochrome b/b6 domain-containing protein [Neoehrlichia mikurensis]UTO56049.1 cytochrome b/b6 domain-containing protein [Neoehrlichia mikurensis]
MAIIIIFLIIVGLYMTAIAPSNTKSVLYSAHKALGIISMVLIMIRIVSRLSSKIPPYSEVIAPFFIIASRFVHILLYVFMIVMPLSGYMMSSASNKPITMIFFDFPLILPTNKNLAFVFHKIHILSAYTLIILIILHILGALKHLIINKDNIFQRIT